MHAAGLLDYRDSRHDTQYRLSGINFKRSMSIRRSQSRHKPKFSSVSIAFSADLICRALFCWSMYFVVLTLCISTASILDSRPMAVSGETGCRISFNCSMFCSASVNSRLRIALRVFFSDSSSTVHPRTGSDNQVVLIHHLHVHKSNFTAHTLNICRGIK